MPGHRAPPIEVQGEASPTPRPQQLAPSSGRGSFPKAESLGSSKSTGSLHTVTLCGWLSRSRNACLLVPEKADLLKDASCDPRVTGNPNSNFHSRENDSSLIS